MCSSFSPTVVLTFNARRAMKTRREGGLKNVHYSRCQLFIGDFEFPPKGKATEPATLPYDQPPFPVCFDCLNYFSASSPRVSVPQNHTGNLWVPSMSGTVSRPRRHPDFLRPLAPLTVSKFRGRSDQSAPNMNVCAFLLYVGVNFENDFRKLHYTPQRRKT